MKRKNKTVSILPTTESAICFSLIAKTVPMIDKTKHGNGAIKKPNIPSNAKITYNNPIDLSKTQAIIREIIIEKVIIIGVIIEIFDIFL